MAEPLPSTVPALIVGAGPIGLACAIAAKRRGVDALVIDAGAIADAIVRYPIGMTFFTTPERLEIGNHPLTCSGAKATREEALKYYRGVARVEQLGVRPYTRLVSAERRDSAILCRVATATGDTTIRTERLVLATGYFGHANLLDVPGEALPHVSHWFDEPHRTAGLDVVIIGGKNSAVETALLCHRAGARVTLVYRRPEFKPSLKYWLRPDLENRIAAGEITAHLGSEVTTITPDTVVVRHATGTTTTIPADRVYALTGYLPDFALLRGIGVAFDPAGERPLLDPDTLESSVPGVYLAGSVGAGRFISEVFIENGRYDGEKIFGDLAERRAADARYAGEHRPVGE
ncbi:MAG: YpdA family putative bacillithiol disulfide reductase [Gemmatimonadales bacterium]|nr:YpdA family putative bacillithiol disulfide reductase [Gemmatimonadales bacterium]